MSIWLRQSTAVTIKFGPGVDFTDNVTPETGLATAMDNASTGIRISKHEANIVDRNDATGVVHDEIGYYDVVLDATDTDTLGPLRVIFNGPTVNLPIVQDYIVVTENTWDSFFGIGNLNVNTLNVSSGAVVHVLPILAPNGFAITTGSEVGDEDRTRELDGIRHELSDAAGTLDGKYSFNIGGDTAPVELTIKGIFNSNNDIFDIFANSGTDASPVWEQIGELVGVNNITITTTHVFDMFSNQIVTDLPGIVQVRIQATGLSSSSFDVDQIFVSKADTSRSVGYANGQIWLDTIGGTAGIERDVNGVADRPTNLIASLKTLSTVVGLSDFHIINGSTVLLFESTVNESYFGDNWILQLGGQNVAGAYFQGAHVSGVGTSATEVHYEGCDVATMSVQIGHFDFCSFSGVVIQTLAGDYNYHDCKSKVPGAGAPVFAKTAGQAITAQWRNWQGGITLSGLEVGDTLTIGGRLGTVDLGNPASAVVVEIRGTYKEIINVGSASVNSEGAIKASDVADILAFIPAQNVAFDDIEFLFVAASDHVTPVTAPTGTAVTRSIDGGAFGAGTGTLAEVGNGIMQYDASAADMNGRIITFRFTASGGTPGAADDVFLTIVTGGV